MHEMGKSQSRIVVHTLAVRDEGAMPLGQARFQRGDLPFVRVQPFVDVVEPSQHALLEPGNVVSDVENTRLDPFEARADLRETIGNGGVERPEAAQNFFIVHASMIRHSRIRHSR
jgi:hypothetical protein